MISIQTRIRIGADGTPSVEVPTVLREAIMDVVLVFQPVDGGDGGRKSGAGRQATASVAGPFAG